MPSKDPRIDAYIDKAQPFARPILRRVRKLVHQAVPAVEETIKWGFPHSARVARAPRPALDPPDDFVAALRRNKKAQSAFDAFPPSHRREYIEWLTDARTDATRQRRLDTALEWIADGKARNWKYER